MGLKGMSVGVRLDGTIDVEIAPEDEDESGWNFSNVTLGEAEFLYEELGRAIARQKERGFPKADPIVALLTAPSADPSSEKTSEP